MPGACSESIPCTTTNSGFSIVVTKYVVLGDQWSQLQLKTSLFVFVIEFFQSQFRRMLFKADGLSHKHIVGGFIMQVFGRCVQIVYSLTSTTKTVLGSTSHDYVGAWTSMEVLLREYYISIYTLYRMSILFAIPQFSLFMMTKSRRVQL